MIKKVCHFTTAHPIDDVRIFTKECVSLANNGFDITLIACGDIAFEDIKKRVKRISLNVPIKNRRQRFFKCSKAVYKKALEIDADIYHFHDPELLPIGLRLKRKGKKVIYDSHEDLPRQISYKSWIPVIIRKPVAFISEKVENFYSSRLDAIITVSDHIKLRFDKLHSNVVVCHNYASIKEFPEAPEWRINRDNICYVGGLSKIRGILEILEASKASNVKLEIAGAFNSQEIEERLNQNNIIYHGVVNRDKVKMIFSNCFAGLVTLLPAPNHNNANPNKLFEYMAAGLPVIASDFEGWKKMIEKYNIGLCVDPTNVEEIAKAILFLNHNKELAKQMGENARKAFVNTFNWQIEEKKLIELYKSL